MKHITLLSLALIVIFTGYSQEPTKWRGENSNGIYPDKGLLSEWPAGGPEILWHFDELGEGHSSAAFASNKIYTTGMINSTGYLFILNKDGKLLKKFAYGPEWEVSWPGTRSTPTIAGNLIYIYSGFGKIVCYDEPNDKVVWTKNVLNDLDGVNIKWGVTESLIIDGDKLFVSPGGKKNNVVALNRMTGELIWSCAANGELSAYCTPQLIKLPNRNLLVTMMTNHIIGIDANTGEHLWSYAQPNKWSVHANTPIYHNSGLLCVSGYGKGAVKLKLNEDGSKVTKEWFSETLDNRMGGIVLINGYIFGSGDNNRNWYCIDWNTGKTIKVLEGINKGVTIAADGKLYCYSEKADLALVKADPEDFSVISKTKVELGSAQHWAHPVINEGILYLRHGNALIAYKLK